MSEASPWTQPPQSWSPSGATLSRGQIGTRFAPVYLTMKDTFKPPTPEGPPVRPAPDRVEKDPPPESTKTRPGPSERPEPDIEPKEGYSGTG